MYPSTSETRVDVNAVEIMSTNKDATNVPREHLCKQVETGNLQMLFESNDHLASQTPRVALP